MDSHIFKRNTIMKITEIRHQPITTYESRAFKNAEVVKKNEAVQGDTLTKSIQDTEWQKNILLDAISSLENNMQMDNSHPLSRADYMPIEDFAEAMNEMPFFSTDLFKSQASSAQANLRAEDVAMLFADSFAA